MVAKVYAKSVVYQHPFDSSTRAPDEARLLRFLGTYQQRELSCSESEALRSEAAVMYVGLGLVVAQTTTDRFLVGFGFEDKGRV